MHALKDRVSTFFSDSPSQVVDPQKQANESTKEGKSYSSLFSYIIPSWSFGRSSLESKLIDFDEEKTSNDHAKLRSITSTFSDTDPDPGSTESNDIFEDAFESQPMTNLTQDSFFITPELYEFFNSSLPNIVKGCQWILLYSTVKDGISLRTLIRKSNELSGPCLLIAGDKKGAVFGGLLECPLIPTSRRKYQGTNQTFVFTTIYGQPRLFRPTGANRYYYMCLNDLLAIGGGNFALRMDGDLLRGTSGPCETFGNLCLAYDEEFELKNIELWGFTHASKYLT